MLQVSAEEIQNIRRIFSDSGSGQHMQQAREEGFRVAGRMFKAVKGDSRSLYGKRVGSLRH